MSSRRSFASHALVLLVGAAAVSLLACGSSSSGGDAQPTAGTGGQAATGGSGGGVAGSSVGGNGGTGAGGASAGAGGASAGAGGTSGPGAGGATAGAAGTSAGGASAGNAGASAAGAAGSGGSGESGGANAEGGSAGAGGGDPCTGVTNVAAPVTPTTVSAPFPTGQGQGGPIVPGTYALTSATYYQGASGVPASETQTLYIYADGTWATYVDHDGMSAIAGGTYSTSATQATFDVSCPVTQAGEAGDYTATSTMLIAYAASSDEVQTFTKQ